MDNVETRPQKVRQPWHRLLSSATPQISTSGSRGAAMRRLLWRMVNTSTAMCLAFVLSTVCVVVLHL